jgi:F-type H+-transporting ATPase subunit delta
MSQDAAPTGPEDRRTPDRKAIAGTVLDNDDVGVRNYADALLGAAEAAGEGVVDTVLEQLEAFVTDVWDAEPRVAALLESPTLAVTEKDRILKEALADRSHPLVLQFLRVLNRHNRLPWLRSAVRRARLSWDRKQNRHNVLVTSAVPLDDAQLDALRERLGPLLGGGTAVIQTRVDPSILGGLVVQTGDYVYDASVRTSTLERLRRRLVEEKVHEVRALRESLT